VARSRNIKPGFFLNDLLAEIEPLGRLLFAGLWTIADKAGRLEYRVKKIKASVLPYDDCDIEKFINELEKRNFITIYIVKNEKYLQINNWSKHQKPHKNENESELPSAPIQGKSNKKLPIKSERVPIKSELEPINSEAIGLIPDSLNIDSLNIDSLDNTLSPQGDDTSTRTMSECPFKEIVALYNNTCSSLPKVQSVSKSRKRNMRTRWVKCPDIELFSQVFAKAEQSDFLSGRSDKWTGCNFDWLIKEQNMDKTLEGVYDNKARAPDMPKEWRGLKSWAEKEGVIDD